MTPDDILFPYLQTAKLCTSASLVISGFQEPGERWCGMSDILLWIAWAVKRAVVAAGA
jgi:hypothetical protein